MSLSTQGAPFIEPPIRLRDNPLLLAQARRRVRREQLAKTLLVPVSLGLCIDLYGITAHDPTGTVWLGVYKLMFFIIGIVLFLRGTAQISGLMSSERTSGILDFHRASPTTGWTDAVGYLLGGCAREYLVVGGFLPFLLFAGVQAEVSIAKMAGALIVITLSATMYHLYGMMVGLTAGQKKSATGSAVGGVLLLLFFGGTLYQTGVMVIAYLTPYPALANLGFLGSERFAMVESVSLYGAHLRLAVSFL